MTDGMLEMFDNTQDFIDVTHSYNTHKNKNGNSNRNVQISYFLMLLKAAARADVRFER